MPPVVGAGLASSALRVAALVVAQPADRASADRTLTMTRDVRMTCSYNGGRFSGRTDTDREAPSGASGSTGLVEGVRTATDPERVQHEVVGGHADESATGPVDLLVSY